MKWRLRGDMASMEIVGIIALVVVVALVVGYVVKGRRGASPADPDNAAAHGQQTTVDRPADAGAEGMTTPEAGDITTGPEDRRP